MSTITGNPKGNQTPSPSAAPGTAIKITLPADSDSNNVATMFTQQYTVVADYLAYVQASTGFSPPVLNAANIGFTARTHTGTGAGTVLPSGSVKIATGTNFKIKIVQSGTLGAALFQMSIDGGTTYGANQGVSASLTCATSGITLAFTGDFVINDTYQFNSAFSPLQTYANTDGYVRNFVDHNGFSGMGRITEIREDWRGIIAAGYTGVTTATAVDGARLTLTQTGSATATIPYIIEGSRCLRQTITQASAKSLIYQSGAPGLFWYRADTVMVAEWESRLTVSGTSLNAAVSVGISSAPSTSPYASSADNISIFAIDGDTTWSLAVSSSTAGAQVLTATTATINTSSLQRFRLEVYGLNSVYGESIRLFVDGALAAQYSLTGSLLSSMSNGFCWYQLISDSGGTPTVSLYTSPVLIKYARLAGSTVPLL